MHEPVKYNDSILIQNNVDEYIPMDKDMFISYRPIFLMLVTKS